MAWRWGANRKSVERLRTLWAEGHSASIIAGMLSEEFGARITRNMVIGARYRWIDGGERKKRTVTRPYGSGRKPSVRKTARRWGEHKVTPPRAEPRALWNLEDWQCHYPVQGQGTAAMYCGSRKYRYGGHGGINRIGFPYCFYHCHMVYKQFDYPSDEELQDAA